MMAVPQWWRAIGGPYAVSRWSAIFTVVLLIPSAIWTAAYSSVTVGGAIVVEAIAAVVALLFLWLAHVTWLSPRRFDGGHRTLLALATYFGIGLVRLFVMYATRATFDIDQPWSPWQSLATGGVFSVVILSIVAIVVDAIRSHAEAMAALRQADESLSHARQLDLATAEQLQRSYVEEVLREVRSGIARLSAGNDSRALAGGLQEIADTVVREGSHSLSRGDVVSEAVAAPRGNVRLLDVARQIRPAAPMLGPIGFEALVFTAVLRDLGGTIAVVNAFLGTSVLIAGNLVLRALARRFWPAHGRLLALAAAYLVVGLGAVVSVGAAVTVLDGQTPALWVGAISYTVFMLFFSAISSLRRGQQEIEGALTESIGYQAAELARVRSLVADQQARLAHLLHGGLQAELTAAALTVSNQWVSGGRATDPQEVIHRLLAEIDRQHQEMDSTPPVLEVEDLFETWRLAMDLEVEFDQAASAQLSEDAELRARVIDVLSEALTNVVRHGDERRAWVTVSLENDRTILLMVRNPGRLTDSSPGLGSEEMTERCAEWSRTQERSDVVLRASFESAARTVG